MKRIVSNKELEKLGIQLVYAPTYQYQTHPTGRCVSITLHPALELWQIVDIVLDKGVEIGIKEGKNLKINEIRRALDEVD